MPRGKPIAFEDMMKSLEKYRALGGGFVKVVEETAEALADFQTVRATYEDLKNTIQKNLTRLETAASVMNGGK